MASELDHLSLGPLHCRSALHINVSPVGTVALETPDLHKPHGLKRLQGQHSGGTRLSMLGHHR